MIDVALKVGELSGGMAEGSIATYQTDDEPLSVHMQTVFALLRVGEDQLPLIEEAFRTGRRIPRRRRIPLRAMAYALSRPGLERQWRSHEPVEPVDVSRFDLRKLMRRGYRVRTPKHEDRNAVSSGKYTVGKRANYTDWNAVLSDIGTSISSELVFTQISPLSYTMNGVSPNIMLNNLNARIIFKSASPLKSNAGAGLTCTDLARTGKGLHVKVNVASDNLESYVEFRDLSFDTDPGASPIVASAFIRTENWSSGAYPLFKIHDCIFLGGDRRGFGVTKTSSDHRFYIWNCKFVGFGVDEVANLGSALNIGSTVHEDSFIENCTLVDNDYGVFHAGADSVKVNNCVAYGNNQKDFCLNGTTKGDNNVSQDVTAEEYDGTSNVANQSGLGTEFVQTANPDLAEWFRLEAHAPLLPAAGKAPEITDNTAGAIGNSRPGTDGEYSVGADELGETFPDDWGIFTKLTINDEKVSGSGSYTMPVLITERAFMITDEIWNNSRDDGGDLRLTADAEGTTPLPLEVVTWDRVNHKCELWATVHLNTGIDVELYLWAGNPSAAQPEANESIGSFYVWANPSSDPQGFVYHCANDISEKYVFDSSSAKKHGPVYIQPLPQTDGLFGYGKKLEFWESFSYWIEFGTNKYEFTDSAQHGFALMHMKAVTGVGGSLIYLSRNGGSTPRVELKDQGNPQGFTVRAAAPDGASIQQHSSSILIGDQVQHIVGARIDLGDKEIDAWVDGTKTQSTGLSFPNSVFDSYTHNLAEIGRDPGSTSPRFYGQEIRYWSEEPYGYSENDGFWATHSAMVEDQVGFWSCGDLHGQAQTGPRKWQFLVPEVGCFGVENTDFWVEYAANIDGTLSAILHAVWDAGSGTDLTGVDKRVELEGRLEELRHIYETLRGDLLIDAGTAWEKLIRGVQLSAVALKEGKTNAALDYDLTFIIGLAGLGMRSIARRLDFGSDVMNAGNFLVEYVGGDRTVFKEVFRAAPIRVPSGPVEKTVLITAIVESIADATPLGRRQKAEATLKDWAWDRLGTEGELKIDGVSLGTVHLAGVQPSNLELPDAVVFDLEFLTGYGS